MNTFLPFNDMVLSAEALDSKRLNKQILECKQIHDALTGRSDGYRFHPATMMWQDAEEALALFAHKCANELYSRSYRRHKYADWAFDNLPALLRDTKQRPWWWGNPYFHESNQQMLIWKDPAHYGARWRVPHDKIPTERPHYIWPVSRALWTFLSPDKLTIHKSKAVVVRATIDPLTMLTSPILVGSNWARYLLQSKERS